MTHNLESAIGVIRVQIHNLELEISQVIQGGKRRNPREITQMLNATSVKRPDTLSIDVPK